MPSLTHNLTPTLLDYLYKNDIVGFKKQIIINKSSLEAPRCVELLQNCLYALINVKSSHAILDIFMPEIIEEIIKYKNTCPIALDPTSTLNFFYKANKAKETGGDESVRVWTATLLEADLLCTDLEKLAPHCTPKQLDSFQKYSVHREKTMIDNALLNITPTSTSKLDIKPSKL